MGKSEATSREAQVSALVRIVFLVYLFSFCVQHLAECKRRVQQVEELTEESNLDAMLMDSAGQVQCEPIAIGFCADMAYQSTRMPNFFGDTNQLSAIDRAHHYQDLAMSKCSAHVHAYVCELLTPVCLEHSQEAMKRFEIYPCRSFCRRVKRDCEEELVKLNARLFSEGTSALLPGFACDQLPFESNGGNGSLRGPCHEMPEPSGQRQQQQQEAKSNYRPYQPALDANVPPFITDTSSIDPNLIKPVSGLFEPPSSDLIGPGASKRPVTSQQPGEQVLAPRPHLQPQVSFMGQLQTFAQGAAMSLARHSNTLSIITVLILLVALFSKRIRRLKRYLRLSPSSSTKSSSTNSTGSQRQLQPAKFALGQQHRFQVSPSASSRSLMLIAGTNKQPASHQLVEPVNGLDPSQKLLYGLQNQRTLININGTLDRQHGNRYQQLVMQSAMANKQSATGKTFLGGARSADKQQLFNTLDSQSSSNQYDSIEVSGGRYPTAGTLPGGDCEYLARMRQQQQQQQLYSNILLSSPSHQVLLLEGPQQQAANLNRAPQQQHHHPPRQRQTGSLSHSSPYDSPASLSGGCGGSGGQSQETRYQRSLQRRARNPHLADNQNRMQGSFLGPTRTSHAPSSASSCSSSNSNSNSNSNSAASYGALSPASSANAAQAPPASSAGRPSPRRPL